MIEMFDIWSCCVVAVGLVGTKRSFHHHHHHSLGMFSEDLLEFVLRVRFFCRRFLVDSTGCGFGRSSSRKSKCRAWLLRRRRRSHHGARRGCSTHGTSWKRVLCRSSCLLGYQSIPTYKVELFECWKSHDEDDDPTALLTARC